MAIMGVGISRVNITQVLKNIKKYQEIDDRIIVELEKLSSLKFLSRIS